MRLRLPSMALVGLLVGFARQAWAFGLTLSPIALPVDVEPGGTATFEFQVANREDAPVPLRIYAWDYWHGKDGRFYSPPGTTPRSATGWIEVAPRETRVEANGSMTFVGTVSVPTDAEGGAYAVVFAQTDYSRDFAAGVTTVTEGRIGAILLVRVVGTGTVALEVPAARFTAPDAARAASVDLEVRNTGTVHARVTFKGFVRTTDGTVLGSVAAPTELFVLPGETRVLRMDWTAAMEPGGYELVGSVLYDEDRAVPVVFPLIVTESVGGDARGGG